MRKKQIPLSGEGLLANLRYRKKWKRLTTILSVFVVVGTLSALILPAVTMNLYICGQEEHTHQDACYTVTTENVLTCTAHLHGPACYDAQGGLLCTQETHQHTDACYTQQQTKSLHCQLPEHTHTDACRALIGLSKQEWQQVEDVASIIEGLPPVEQIEAQLSELASDPAALAAYREKILGAIRTAFDEYGKLSEAQQSVVPNGQRLKEYEYLLDTQKITDLIIKIEALPSVAAIEEKLAQMAEDPDALADYRADIAAMIGPLYAAYDSFTQSQKASVTNASALLQLVTWLREHGFCSNGIHEVMLYTDASHTKLLEESSVSLAVHGRLPIGARIRAHCVEYNIDDAPTLSAWDISICLEDGSRYLLEEPVTLTFSGVDIRDGMEPDVLHIHNDGSIERPDFQISGNTVTITADSFSTYAVIDSFELNRMAEKGDPAAVQALIDSGFFTYWESAVQTAEAGAPPLPSGGYRPFALLSSRPSDSQITYEGGSATDGTVTVSKTIDGTDVENVFDITLTVDTTTNIQEIIEDPDMAVVIVMDISNTMNERFGDYTRYGAAIASAEAFLDKFAGANKGYSRIGFVAFNTDAHQIFGLSECSTTEQANGLRNTMRTKTGEIITASGYGDSHARFTNIEAGLKMGYDMLNASGNSNKYIIFLSDGFPTTYVKSGYLGYDPYCSGGTKGADGVFYDYVTGYYCAYGTSYSDKAAIRARQQAAAIKAVGTKIFSIGIDVGGQTIAGYDGRTGLSVIDRTGSTYELGSATDTNAFKNWLRNSIGSGYYYDSTDTTGLQAAYDQIFAEIKSLTESSNALKWIASDPMPMATDGNQAIMEFLGFYDNSKKLQVYEPVSSLVGSAGEYAENTVSYSAERNAISWNLKQSGYTVSGSGTTTVYHYEVTYRVRLKNELPGFVEHQSYQTNGKTILTYQEVTVVDGVETISADKTVEFPIPEVKGYLGTLTFQKVTEGGDALQGAQFALIHDSTACPVCRGDGKTTVAAVAEATWTATSGADGMVTFPDLPSGHTYQLRETVAPQGYHLPNVSYTVVISYDEVTVYKIGQENQPWDFSGETPTVVNYAGAILPATGGVGTLSYTIGGLAMVAVACALMYNTKRKQRKGAK